jgi:hypothetical protein
VVWQGSAGDCRPYADQIANALIEERWRSPEVPYFGRVAGKQDICTAEAAERSRKAPPGRFQAHRENPTLPGQTYTFTCTLSQLLKTTCFICNNLRATATHLKFAGLNRPWGFKSPSGHQKNLIYEPIHCLAAFAANLPCMPSGAIWGLLGNNGAVTVATGDRTAFGSVMVH